MMFFLFFSNVYKTIGLNHIKDDYLLSYITGAGFMLGAIFRVILGKLLDHFTWRAVNLFKYSIEFKYNKHRLKN